MGVGIASGLDACADPNAIIAGLRKQWNVTEVGVVSAARRTE